MLTRDEFDGLIKKSLQEGKTTFIVRDEDGFPFHVIPQKEYMELEELKRVPTAKEVCEAIQAHLTLANKIVYNEKNNSFELEYGNPPTYCIQLAEYKEGLVTHCLPFATPKMLILIGKFYEGQANKMG